MFTRKTPLHIPFSLLLALCLVGCSRIALKPEPQEAEFDQHRAYQDIQTQLSFGSRAPGTPGHQQALGWIRSELKSAGWQVTVQSGTRKGVEIHNVIGYRERGGGYILLGAHYDTRLWADQDPDPEKRDQPVPGANDGASGVAVLLELARILPEDLGVPVKLVFFDLEDNGDIRDWGWIMGSTLYVERMEGRPRAVVILDMVGDKDLNLYQERSSTPALRGEIWRVAGELGYEDAFIPSLKYTIIDDHTPFLERGIPAVDVIDFDYPHWHTTADTLDKVSPESLNVVGETILSWVSQQVPGKGK